MCSFEVSDLTMWGYSGCTGVVSCLKSARGFAYFVLKLTNINRSYLEDSFGRIEREYLEVFLSVFEYTWRVSLWKRVCRNWISVSVRVVLVWSIKSHCVRLYWIFYCCYLYEKCLGFCIFVLKLTDINRWYLENTCGRIEREYSNCVWMYMTNFTRKKSL